MRRPRRSLSGLPPEPQPEPTPHQQFIERLKSIIGRLETDARDRVSKRTTLEKRWVEDLEQYWGKYDEKTRKALANGNKSRLYINLTRPKTDGMSARLMDLLFPTDDKNWGINPTPVPALSKAASESAAAAQKLAKMAIDAAAQAEGQGNPQAAELALLQERAAAAKRQADAHQLVLDEAATRAEAMTNEIDDQLKESLYPSVMRDVIEDGCKYGTGVCKGPVVGDRVRKGWKQRQVTGPDGAPVMGANGQPATEYGLEMSHGNTPAMRYVDLWSFFPDMDVRNIQDGEGVFERHLMNRKKLRGLAQLAGFDKDAIRRLLEGKPQMAAPSYLADLRNITGDNQQVANDVYHVWEYSGPLSPDDMRDLALAMGDAETGNDLSDIDPLIEVNAIVWFCQGELLKFAIYPFDSGECMYSVFNLAKDESSVFGYGIPAIVRDPQRSLNAGWRAMMDNAGLATGPQIVIAQSLIEPADGDWNLSPRKVWLAKEGLPQNHRAFDAFDVPMHQAELANIIALSQRFIDDMSAMPAIAQGEQGAGVTKTAQGMALLMNSTNVVFRRIVKNFDDDVTTPNIRRFYDWNMQFNPKESIKGDFEVDARGSSVLLVREMQAQTLMMVATQLGAHPIYGPMLKNRNVLRKMFQAMMIPSSEVVLTDDEIDAVLAKSAAEQEAAAKAASEGAVAVKEADISARVGIANMQTATQLRIAAMNRDTEMMKLAQQHNMTLDEIEAKLWSDKEDRDSKERMAAADIITTQRMGQPSVLAGV